MGIKIGNTDISKMYVYVDVQQREPGANTVAYYPLTADTNDASGNGLNMTNSGIIFGTYDGITCGYCNGNYAYKYGNPFTGDPTFTVSVWEKYITRSTGANLWSLGIGGSNNSFCLWINNGRLYTGGWSNDRDTGYNIDNDWHNVVFAYSSGSGTIYIDKQAIYTGTWSPDIQSTIMTIGSNANQGDAWYGYISNVIFEDKEWSSQDATDYFELTKGDYGIS